MYDPNQRFGITSQDQTSMEAFDELIYTGGEDGREEIKGKDIEVVPTNENIIGLEKILLESRK